MDYFSIEREFGDLLRAAYNCGYCHGAGIPMDEPDDPLVKRLLTRLATLHMVDRQIPARLRALAAEDAGETAPLGNGTRC